MAKKREKNMEKEKQKKIICIHQSKVHNNKREQLRAEECRHD